MKVLLVEPLKEPYMKEIPDKLEDMQKLVGGFIEAVYYFKEPVAVVCNEEGKINGLPLNRAIYNDEGKLTDIIAGTFFVAGIGKESFDSLPEEFEKQFTKRFKYPEYFIRINDEIKVIPIKFVDCKNKNNDIER